MATRGTSSTSNVVTLDDIPKPPAWASNLSDGHVKKICTRLLRQSSEFKIDFSKQFLFRMNNVLLPDVHGQLDKEGLSQDEKKKVLFRGVSDNRRAFERLTTQLMETDQYGVLEIIKKETTQVKSGKEHEKRKTGTERSEKATSIKQEEMLKDVKILSKICGTKTFEAVEPNNGTDTGKDEPDTPAPIPAKIQHILDMNPRQKEKELKEQLNQVAPDLLEAIKITESLVEYLNKNGKTMLHTNETLKNTLYNNSTRVSELIDDARRDPIRRVRVLLTCLVATRQNGAVDKFDSDEFRACLGYDLKGASGTLFEVIAAQIKPGSTISSSSAAQE